MQSITKLSIMTLLSFAGAASANAYYEDEKNTKFYIGSDIARIYGSVEGKKIFINKDENLTNWGFTAGYEFNGIFSLDAYYSEDDKFDIKNYGVRFNARPVVYGPIYAVGTLGLNETKFVAKGAPLTDNPFAPDFDRNGNANYEQYKDKTGIDSLYAIGLGCRYQQVDYEVKYVKYGDFDGAMGSLMVRF